MDDEKHDELSLALEAVRRGETGADERLFGLVYRELHQMAHLKMAREGPGNTLQTTALVHEAYLKLFRGEDPNFENRRHFFGAAANAMRRILIDRARTKKAKVHGGDMRRVPLQDDVPDAERPLDLLALDEALTRLAVREPRQAEVVGYRYFLGMTVPETASLLQVSPKTVDNDWAFAKAWLRREIARSDERNGGESVDGP